MDNRRPFRINNAQQTHFHDNACAWRHIIGSFVSGALAKTVLLPRPSPAVTFPPSPGVAFRKTESDALGQSEPFVRWNYERGEGGAVGGAREGEGDGAVKKAVST